MNQFAEIIQMMPACIREQFIFQINKKVRGVLVRLWYKIYAEISKARDSDVWVK